MKNVNSIIIPFHYSSPFSTIFAWPKLKCFHLPCTSYVYVGETHTCVSELTHMSWPHPPTYLVSVNSPTYPELTNIPCVSKLTLSWNHLHTLYQWRSGVVIHDTMSHMLCACGWNTSCRAACTHCTIQETTGTTTQQGRWWADQKHWLWFTFWNHICSPTTRVPG